VSQFNLSPTENFLFLIVEKNVLDKSWFEGGHIIVKLIFENINFLG